MSKTYYVGYGWNGTAQHECRSRDARKIASIAVEWARRRLPLELTAIVHKRDEPLRFVRVPVARTVRATTQALRNVA